MTPLDWIIVAGMYALIVGAVVMTRRSMHGVSDYLAAGRAAGPYPPTH
jgi:hypothetical protein